MFDSRRRRNWIFPALWTIQIFYFSLLPRASYPKMDGQQLGASYLQYIYHFGQYFCLSLLVYGARRRDAEYAQTPERRGRILKHAMLVIAVIALLDELVQVPAPTRTFAIPDLMADMAGGSLGLLVMHRGKRSEIVSRHELGTG